MKSVPFQLSLPLPFVRPVAITTHNPWINGQKQCFRCGVYKAPSCFSGNKVMKDGLRAYCHPCSYIQKCEVIARKRLADPEWVERERARDREFRKRLYSDPAKREAARLTRNAGKRRRRRENPEKYRAIGLREQLGRKRRPYNGKERFTEEQWQALCERYNRKCLCCGEAKPLCRDHVVPLKLGGENTIENIQPLCRECNGRKGAREIDYRDSSPGSPGS